MSAPPSTAASSRRQSAASSPLADEEDGFAAALALQEAAARPGLAKKEVARLLEKACARYSAAELRGPAPPGALYNHAVALTDFSRIPPSGSGSGGGGSSSGDGGNENPPVAAAAAAEAAAEEAQRTRRARLRLAAAKYHEAIVEETSTPSAAAAAESASWNAGGSPSAAPSSSPQALNNLGLVLQELSAFEPAGSASRAALAAAAAARFRAAARGRPDFERAVYNLGTVLYASAPPAVTPVAASSSSSVPSTPSASSSSSQQQQQQARAEALADAAQCVALAAALAPAAPVYARSLALVQPFLPLPRLRAGWLLIPDPLPLGTWTSSSSSQHQTQQQPSSSRPFFLPGSVTAAGNDVFPSSRERFVARWCVVDAEALRATNPPAGAPAAPRGWGDESGGGGSGSGGSGSGSHGTDPSCPLLHRAARPLLHVPLAEVLTAAPAADASLPGPAGAGLHLRFASSAFAPPAGIFVVAPSHAAAEAWADALCVAGHVARRSSTKNGGGSAALARVLAPAVGTVAVAGSGPLAHRRPSSSGLAR